MKPGKNMVTFLVTSGIVTLLQAFGDQLGLSAADIEKIVPIIGGVGGAKIVGSSYKDRG